MSSKRILEIIEEKKSDDLEDSDSVSEIIIRKVFTDFS